MANMSFKANILPATSQSYNLGSSTQQWVVYGPIHSNGLYGTPNIDYGGTLPATAVEGQIFFQTSTATNYTVPPGGTAGYALIKNSNADGDFYWGEIAAGVTGVKGDAESTYRTGDINLTPANIGAASSNHNHDSTYLKLSGGTMTGAIYTHGLVGAPNIDYGSTLPASAIPGQLFFQTSNTVIYSVPAGGIAGYALVKNSSTDGDFSWQQVQSGVSVTGTGNAITTITANNGVITGIKETTFAVSSHTHTLSVATTGTGNVITSVTNNNGVITGIKEFNFSTEDHTHGNVSNVGAITTSATLANNDKLIFSDASDNNKIKTTSISFDGSSTQSALSKSGDWINYLEIAGGTMTGAISIKGLYGTEDIDYGDTLPTTASEGQIFFQVADELGYSVPIGGTTGQALIKHSNADGDIEWGTIEALPTGGTTGQVLTKNSSTDGDASWATVNALPTGGTIGQVLTKNSNTNGDVSWSNVTYANSADYAVSASSANYATSAAQDGSGNVITTTYLTIADATATYAFKSTSAEAAIANNDSLLFADNSNNEIITRATIKFDGSTTASYLSKAGTWESAPVSSVANRTGTVILDSLTIGDKSYNGSTTVTIGVADLGLSSPMTFRGVTDTALTNDDTTVPVNIVSGGTIGSLSPNNGDVVLQQTSQLEFIYTGSEWKQLGLASSYSLANHVHGNMFNKGSITTTATIANGDRLIIADASDSETGKLVASSISFDGSTTTQVLAKSGTWVDMMVTTAPHAVTAGYALNAITATRATTAGYATTASRATYAASSGKVSITQNDTSNWSQAIEFHKTTDYTETYKPGVGYHNTGDTNGAFTLIPYAITTNPWTGDKGLYIGKNTLKWEDKVILHSGNFNTYAASASHSHSYLPLSGGTMTGNITMSTNTYLQKAGSSVSWYQGRNSAVIKTTSYSGYNAIYSLKTTSGDWCCGVYTDNKLYWTYITDSNYNNNSNTTTAQMRLESNGYLYTTRTYGAVWNDYAEFRKDNLDEKEIQKPGHCVKEIGNGQLQLTTKRLERGCEIISDTFGFSIGQDEENGYNTPIASSGRVLAYPYESIAEFQQHIGWPVCSGPNGTVSIMTEEEEAKYPSRIIGTISEIPIYEEWGTGKIKVDGRIWIRIR